MAVKPGAEKLLSFLQEKGIKSYITSSSDMEKINFNLSHNDLRQYSAGIVAGEDVKNNKPAPDIYLHALDIAKVNKNEAVIFEDAPNGVESGLNAGIDVVLVPDQVMPSEEITKKVTVVKTLADAIPLFE
ncbi:haloacid dehalogenase [Lactobacillus helveticus]|nr:MAG: HAD family hydrolase [Lactobacillus helveticus]MCS8612113.1 HAD family hydrolase [Lactobacillus helveticus]MCT3394398.1 HAD family hydrolase [Lactobacillus helveticus]MCT3400923.1 HAD family hydrolase [Lactobacillus helveticus]MCT3410101.1 HAD family hydrolase [Lactobacillus helveticus]